MLLTNKNSSKGRVVIVVVGGIGGDFVTKINWLKSVSRLRVFRWVLNKYTCKSEHLYHKNN